MDYKNELSQFIDELAIQNLIYHNIESYKEALKPIVRAESIPKNCEKHKKKVEQDILKLIDTFHSNFLAYLSKDLIDNKFELTQEANHDTN